MINNNFFTEVKYKKAKGKVKRKSPKDRGFSLVYAPKRAKFNIGKYSKFHFAKYW